MKRHSKTARGTLTILATSLAAVFMGGAVMGTCQLRMRDALVDGTKLFFLNLFNPSSVTITADVDVE